MVIPITIKIDEKALELIDRAAKEEFSSRTNYMVRHSTRAAKQLIEVTDKPYLDTEKLDLQRYIKRKEL